MKAITKPSKAIPSFKSPIRLSLSLHRMSFFPSYKPQAQIRQEGFHLPDSTTPPPPPPQNFDIFNPFLPDLRKFPSAGVEGANTMDFGDELASLIQHSNERSTQSPQPNINGTSAPSPAVDPTTGSTSYDNDGGYHGHRPQTHNIFDISAPPPASATAPDSYPSAPNFNPTSIRYDPHHDNGATHPPSSFHPAFQRHTPSPSSHLHSQLESSHRSRSRSRPPSGGGVGPARTTRSRRNNSVSGTSPPPPRPHAIVIPRSRASTVAGPGNGGPGAGSWFVPGHSS